MEMVAGLFFQLCKGLDPEGTCLFCTVPNLGLISSSTAGGVGVMRRRILWRAWVSVVDIVLQEWRRQRQYRRWPDEGSSVWVDEVVRIKRWRRSIKVRRHTMVEEGELFIVIFLFCLKLRRFLYMPGIYIIHVVNLIHIVF